jgi:hypothetical protein
VEGLRYTEILDPSLEGLRKTMKILRIVGVPIEILDSV